MTKSKWLFPPKSGNSFDGFNDAGIETFRGNRFQSFAREFLQNSLDAKDPRSTKPVTVVFEVMDIDREDFPGVGEFQKTLSKCLVEAEQDDKARNFFKNALKTLKKKKIRCLRVEDHYTTGLRGEPNDRRSQWFAMINSGITAKGSEGAGGSYGIGKNAPFAVSFLRTVFYYTYYIDGDAPIERMQGKAILMSHETSGKERAQGVGYAQATGSYGTADGCAPVDKSEIPDFMRRQTREGLPASGTTLFIPGFEGGANWHVIIASAILANFFYAIYSGNLEVMIDSGKSQGEELLVIEKDKIVERFEYLLKEKGISDEDKEKLKDGKDYLDAIIHAKNDSEYKEESEQAALGRCELLLKKSEKLPKKVGVIRQTGMLITDDMQGLKRFPNFADFAGVLICHAPKGNELLQRMENPQHNAFEPGRLVEGEIPKGKKALDDLAKWARQCIKELAGGSATDKQVALTELGKFIPNYDSDDLPDEQSANEEPNIEGELVITLRRPKKSKKPPSSSWDVHQRDDFEEENTEGDGLGGSGMGSGIGDGSEEESSTGGSASKPAKNFPIKNLRILSSGARKKRVMFMPEKTGNARFSLKVAGDSLLEGIEIEKIEMQSQEIRPFRLSVTAGERVSLDVTLREDIPHALLLVAYEIEEKEEDS